MKPRYSFLLIVILFLAACKGGENKADQSDVELAPKSDTPAPTTSQPEADTTAKSGQSRGIEVTDPAAILGNINKHLVTAAKFTPAAGGGFTDCIVTVSNTLPDASFQKALVEVSVKREDGGTVKTDYYTVVNIDPGMTKNIKVPNSTQGSAVHTAVIKIKSAELTNGEFVLTSN